MDCGQTAIQSSLDVVVHKNTFSHYNFVVSIAKKKKMHESDCGVRVAIDLSYDDLMSEKVKRYNDDVMMM